MSTAVLQSTRSLPDQYLWFRSDDLDEARTLISQAYDGHRLRLLSDNDQLGVSLHHAKLNSVSLSIIEYSADVEVAVDESTGVYVLMPLQGSLEVRYQDKSIECKPGSGVIVNSGIAFDKVLRGNYAQLVVRFDGKALQQNVTNLCPAGSTAPICFESLLDKDTPRGASWMRTVQYVVDELRNADADCPHVLIAKPLEQLLINNLLRSQPNNYLEVLSGESAPKVVPWYVKKVEQYIQHHYGNELTVEALAGIADVSARSLQYGFKNSFGATPMQYLKQVRLDKVREGLLQACDDAVITDIAMDCGFRQLGRFAKSYRDRFGESPSETLQRKHD